MREQRSKYPRSTFISHPRSGLTWFRWMMHEVRKLHDPENLKAPPIDTEEWNPLIAYDHDGIGLRSPQSMRKRSNRSSGVNAWSDYRVVFLIRDPRDVLLSNYYRMVVRGKQVVSEARSVRGYDLGAFIKCDTLGLKPLVEWICWWDKHRHECVDFMPIFYEDTLLNPASTLSCVLEMATEENVPMGTVREAVEASTFEKMRRHEEVHGTIYKDQSGPVNSDPSTALIRKGLAGQWRDEFSEGLKGWCEKEMRDLEGTFAARYTQ